VPERRTAGPPEPVAITMTDNEINEKFDKLFTALEEIRDTIPKGSSASIGVIMEHTAGIEGQLKTLNGTMATIYDFLN
jgi:hypothetical protein